MTASDPTSGTYGARAPMEGVRLFHGVILDVPEFAAPAYEALHRNFEEPFVGITIDGTPRPGLTSAPSEAPSTAAVAEAGRAYLESLSRPDHRAEALQPLDHHHRRWWFNAFPDWSHSGVLLDDIAPEEREAAMRVIAASMSEEGYGEVRKAMRLNGLLGDFVNTYVDSLREFTYWFTIFGEPRPDRPWAWQLMGHHIDLNCLVLPEHTVQTPMFLGSEFNNVEGVTVFERQAQAGRDLLAALTDEQRKQAVLFASMDPSVLPAELAGPVDGRHRGGAGRDNVVLPYEGTGAAGFDETARERLSALVEVYLSRLPEAQRRHWSATIEEHLDETHFAWIGDPSGEPPYYFKVHSPVVWIEFDHHPGIFLDNDTPEPYHVHTILRTPNGGDYGFDLLAAATKEER